MAETFTVKADGSQPFTADQSMGTKKLTSLGAPTSAADAATKSYADALITSGISGTAGKLAKFTSANAIGNSNVAEDGSGNIGIGTTTPGARLDVVHDFNGITEAAVQNIDSGASALSRVSAGDAHLTSYSSGYADPSIASKQHLLAAGAGLIVDAAADIFFACGGDYSDVRMKLSATNLNSLVMVNSLKGANVASASTITPTGNVFHVTGTTTINTIDTTGINAGTTITLIFDGALTVSNAGNILPPGGAFVSTANDTLTLVYDGTSWFGAASSVN